MQIPSTASSLEDHSSLKKKKKKEKETRRFLSKQPRYLVRAVMAQKREDASQRRFWEKKKPLGQSTDVLSFHF